MTCFGVGKNKTTCPGCIHTLACTPHMFSPHQRLRPGPLLHNRALDGDAIRRGKRPHISRSSKVRENATAQIKNWSIHTRIRVVVGTYDLLAPLDRVQVLQRPVAVLEQIREHDPRPIFCLIQTGNHITPWPGLTCWDCWGSDLLLLIYPLGVVNTKNIQIAEGTKDQRADQRICSDFLSE